MFCLVPLTFPPLFVYMWIINYRHTINEKQVWNRRHDLPTLTCDPLTLTFGLYSWPRKSHATRTIFGKIYIHSCQFWCLCNLSNYEHTRVTQTRHDNRDLWSQCRNGSVYKGSNSRLCLTIAICPEAETWGGGQEGTVPLESWAGGQRCLYPPPIFS